MRLLGGGVQALRVDQCQPVPVPGRPDECCSMITWQRVGQTTCRQEGSETRQEVKHEETEEQF